MSEPYHPDAYAVHGYPVVGDNPTTHPDRMATIRDEAAAMGLAPTADPLTFKAFGWTFRRRWVYWIAHGPAIPLSVAEDLWQSHGGALRVDGHCGSPWPLKPVDHYHIDTPQAMTALLDVLRRGSAPLPLSDLRDPLGFLSGARVPVICGDPMRTCDRVERAEWCDNGALLFHPENVSFWYPKGAAVWTMLALDLADPDVARWVDRKIAEAYYGVPFYAAVLDICDGEWRLLTWSEQPNSQEPLTAPCLAAITCGAESVPAARAALVRHLFGREIP